jgi:hypothetical protein
MKNKMLGIAAIIDALLARFCFVNNSKFMPIIGD